ncbi:hypothetical protein GGR26_002237 [Lewinella marina]|uniref:Glyoxalase n=1 Tax=Neolewinella marina TaxID=438751 RepID=A0A2G0CGH6_9BACT|nr:hypothetical protein [Neolewinella marina]NJB86469.1 hypothetical protein [Neolewinella marina]PHK99071.1 hypothetical protein CGL56_06315 [Neolewinella marina]
MRPTIDTQASDSPEEAFQNATLRPVLKQQHELLTAMLRHYLVKRKVNPEQVPAARRFEKIKELVTRDNRLRGLLFGIVIGQFSAEELGYYLQQESEINRRITNLLVERLRSAW